MFSCTVYSIRPNKNLKVVSGSLTDPEFWLPTLNFFCYSHLLRNCFPKVGRYKQSDYIYMYIIMQFSNKFHLYDIHLYDKIFSQNKWDSMFKHEQKFKNLVSFKNANVSVWNVTIIIHLFVCTYIACKKSGETNVGF